VVGIDHYADAPLERCVSDAEGMPEPMGRFGGEVRERGEGTGAGHLLHPGQLSGQPAGGIRWSQSRRLVLGQRLKLHQLVVGDDGGSVWLDVH
jgi:hypothetical protein